MLRTLSNYADPAFKRRKALANSSPGFEHSENPGNKNLISKTTLKALASPREAFANSFGVGCFHFWLPRVEATLGSISRTPSAFRRGSKFANAFGVQKGLEFANAFGVQKRLKFANAFGVQNPGV